MNRKQRKQVAATLAEKIAGAEGGFLIDFQGLNVEATNDLRKKLRSANTELKVTKNTLLRIASQDTDFELLKENFIGPTAIVFFRDDPALVAKILTTFIKDNPSRPLKIKAGILDKKIVNAQEIEQLGDLPPREVLLAQLFSLLGAPARGLVSVLAELERKFLRVLCAIAEAKKQSE